MGHRTLVAYDRGGYDLHYAHWGVDPIAITRETPFGGPPGDTWARDCAEDLLDAEGGRLTDDYETAIESDPIATGLSFGEVCGRVDPLEHETLYVVGPDFSVRRYLVFALPGADGGPTHRPAGVLVGYDDETDASYLRGWLAGARSVRNVTGLTDDAIVRALRWLDPDRGTVVWVSGRADDKRAT